MNQKAGRAELDAGLLTLISTVVRYIDETDQEADLSAPSVKEERSAFPPGVSQRFQKTSRGNTRIRK